MSFMKYVLLYILILGCSPLYAGEIEYSIHDPVGTPQGFNFTWTNLDTNKFGFDIPKLQKDTHIEIELELKNKQNVKLSLVDVVTNQIILEQKDNLINFSTNIAGKTTRLILESVELLDFEIFKISSHYEPARPSVRGTPQSTVDKKLYGRFGGPTASSSSSIIPPLLPATKPKLFGFTDSEWSLTNCQKDETAKNSEDKISILFTEETTQQLLSFELPVFMEDQDILISFTALAENVNCFVQLIDITDNTAISHETSNQETVFLCPVATIQDDNTHKLMIGMLEAEKKYQLVFFKDESPLSGSLTIDGLVISYSPAAQKKLIF